MKDTHWIPNPDEPEGRELACSRCGVLMWKHEFHPCCGMRKCANEPADYDHCADYKIQVGTITPRTHQPCSACNGKGWVPV